MVRPCTAAAASLSAVRQRVGGARGAGSPRFSPGPASLPTKFTPENSCLINAVFINFLEKGVLVSTKRVLGDSGKKARAWLWSPRGTWRAGLWSSCPTRFISPACRPGPGQEPSERMRGSLRPGSWRIWGAWRSPGGQKSCPSSRMGCKLSPASIRGSGLLRPRRPGREHLSPCHKPTVSVRTPSLASSKSPELLIFSRLPQASNKREKSRGRFQCEARAWV